MSRSLTLLLATCCVLGSSACPANGPVDGGPADDDDEPAPPAVSRFEAPALAPGAQLVVHVVDIDGAGAQIDVTASGLDSVFGLGWHLVVDDGLALDPPDVLASAQEDVLGPAEDALYVAAGGGNDRALGGTRRAPDRGDVLIADDTLLLAVDVTHPGPGAYRIAVERALARRADGTRIAIAGTKGTLFIEEDAP